MALNNDNDYNEVKSLLPMMSPEELDAALPMLEKYSKNLGVRQVWDKALDSTPIPYEQKTAADFTLSPRPEIAEGQRDNLINLEKKNSELSAKGVALDRGMDWKARAISGLLSITPAAKLSALDHYAREDLKAQGFEIPTDRPVIERVGDDYTYVFGEKTENGPVLRRGLINARGADIGDLARAGTEVAALVPPECLLGSSPSCQDLHSPGLFLPPLRYRAVPVQLIAVFEECLQ